VVVVERNAASFVFSTATPLSGLAFGSDVLRGSTFGGLNVEDSYCDFIGEGIIVPGPVLNETPRKEMQT
jgi:hypothetical protein